MATVYAGQTVPCDNAGIMTDTRPTLDDPCAALASPEIQSAAADLARDIFTQAFRHAAGEPVPFPLDTTHRHCLDWVQTAADADARALRMALLLTGLDQWGLAFSQAFDIQAIPPLSALIGALRTGLSPADEALFHRHYESLDATETAAIDFKIALRRQIHLALWHAMAAGENLESAEPILHTLGSQLLALDAGMPELGWRLAADTLAHIQLRLLDNPAAPELAQSGTQCLFASLRQAWPKDHYERILAQATQAVLSVQQARRTAH